MIVECPICEEGKLVQEMEINTFTYRGVDLHCPLYYHSCTSCGDLGVTEDMRKNKCASLQWKYLVDMELFYD